MTVTNPNMSDTATAAKLKSQTPVIRCGKCFSQTDAVYVLHDVAIKNYFRRLCTSCVLRLHRNSFCPGCFGVYYGDSLPDPFERIPCSKCSSYTHSHCTGDYVAPNYVCPLCEDPSFAFFPLKDNKIDEKLNLVMLCAAKVAAFSMGKALAIKEPNEAPEKLNDQAGDMDMDMVHMDNDADGDAEDDNDDDDGDDDYDDGGDDDDDDDDDWRYGF